MVYNAQQKGGSVEQWKGIGLVNLFTPDAVFFKAKLIYQVKGWVVLGNSLGVSVQRVYVVH